MITQEAWERMLIPVPAANNDYCDDSIPEKNLDFVDKIVAAPSMKEYLSYVSKELGFRFRDDRPPEFYEGMMSGASHVMFALAMGAGEELDRTLSLALVAASARVLPITQRVRKIRSGKKKP